jgi:elongation factor Ts
MMECKKALEECDGNMEDAVKVLRERGMAVAAKRAGKDANQGIIAASENDDGTIMAMVEVNCETDFAARNDSFKAFVDEVANKALESDDSLAEVMADELIEKVASIGENLKIRRNVRYQLAANGRLGSYIHMGGKVGVLIEVACEKQESVDNPAVIELVKDLTLHIAATSPAYLTSDEIPADVLAEERKIYAKQVEGKPENIIDKIVDGKIHKFYSEVCLVDQPFVKEPKMSITDLLKSVGKDVGDTFSIVRFTRYQLGA